MHGTCLDNHSFQKSHLKLMCLPAELELGMFSVNREVNAEELTKDGHAQSGDQSHRG